MDKNDFFENFKNAVIAKEENMKLSEEENSKKLTKISYKSIGTPGCGFTKINQGSNPQNTDRGCEPSKIYYDQ